MKHTTLRQRGSILRQVDFKRDCARRKKIWGFLFLATQRPTLLDETITAQFNTKFVFRTVRGTDIATLREETDLTQEEGKRLPYLRSGDTFVSSAIFGRTCLSAFALHIPIVRIRIIRLMN